MQEGSWVAQVSSPEADSSKASSQEQLRAQVAWTVPASPGFPASCPSPMHCLGRERRAGEFAAKSDMSV